MAVLIVSSIVDGSGTLPKNIATNSSILLDATENLGINTVEWEFLSKPTTASALISSPVSPKTKVGPLDVPGVYQVKLLINRNSNTQKIKTAAFSVPGTISPRPTASTPGFLKTTGKVRNGSFELPGILDGWAAYWNISDEADILDSGAGITRGRCIPTNFNTDGTYAMVLGDDISGKANFKIGETFEVYQDVDFANMSILRLKIRFKKI